MSEKQTPIEDVIERFGGPSRLAVDLSEGRPKPLRSHSVSMWKSCGHVPSRWHLPLLRLAEERGVDLSAEELLDMTRRK